MSANVETMAFVGEVPWHGMGVEVPSNLTPDEMLIKAGLNWTVSTRPMFYKPVAPGLDAGDAAITEKVDEHFALVRDSDNRLLDVVGHRYKPTQNREAFDFFDKFIKECKLQLHTAGSLCGGQYVWALAKDTKQLMVAANDQVDSYVLLMSPHKLGRSLIAQHTTVRVVCQNTLNLAMQQGKAAFRMSHAKTFDATAKAEAAEVLGLIHASMKQFGEHGKFLASKKANILDVRQFFGAVFDLEDEAIDNDNNRANGLMGKLLGAYAGGAPGSTLPSAKGTWWGALNAVTYVLDHKTGSDKERSLRENWLGYRGNLKRDALTIALEMAA
jgi:phage/plasmid-like protein (TIGR03299 family)